MTADRRFGVTSVGALIVLLLLPSIVSVTQVLLLTQALTYALFALSLYLLLADGGVVSFGHAAFLGAGAYVVGLGTTKWGLSLGVSVILAPLICAILAAIVGWFSVRLTALYFAMLTLAAGQFLYALVTQVDYFGGAQGLLGLPTGFLGIEPSHFYYAALVLLATVFAIVVAVGRSPFGLALRATRENSVRSEFIGLDVRWTRFAAFVLCGALAGLAGVLLAVTNGAVSGDLGYWTQSGSVLVMILIGGMSSVWGPVIGAIVLTYGQKYVSDIATSYWELVLGVILISLVLFFPQGLTGGLAGRAPRDRPVRLRGRWRARAARR